MNKYSDLLFAKMRLSEGVGSVIDLFGVLQEFNESETPQEADAKALWSDFMAVGVDIQDAVEVVSKKTA